MHGVEYLEHHGIKGQKWGIRRFQSKDGPLTSEGKRRYSPEEKKAARKEYKASKKQWKSDMKQVRKDAKVDWKRYRKDFIKSQANGKRVTSTLLWHIGTSSYNSLRASGYSKAVSTGTMAASGLLLGPVGYIALGNVVGSTNYRSSYVRTHTPKKPTKAKK